MPGPKSVWKSKQLILFTKSISKKFYENPEVICIILRRAERQTDQATNKPNKKNIISLTDVITHNIRVHYRCDINIINTTNCA